MTKKIIIDCDPGVDDAIALLLAISASSSSETTPQLDILGITTVAGNVPLSLTQKNARKICELAERPNLPVYAGCPRPLLRSLATAEEVHGATGLEGVALPEPQMPLQPEHGVDFLIETLMSSSEAVTLATLGPLTNLAVAIVKAPQILSRIEEVVVMGGAITHGNITPSAEFNIYVDPHAAHIVFTSGVKLALISLDVTHQAIATLERLAAIRAIGNPIGTTVANLIAYYSTHDMQRYGFAGAPLHDPCVIAYLLQPELFDTRDLYVEVEIASERMIGRTIVDWWRSTANSPNATVATAINADGFYQLLIKQLSHLQAKLTRHSS